MSYRDRTLPGLRESGDEATAVQQTINAVWRELAWLRGQQHEYMPAVSIDNVPRMIACVFRTPLYIYEKMSWWNM